VTPRLLAFALCAGCFPGEIEVAGERDKLRTALYRPAKDEGVLEYTTQTVLLSTAQVACGLPETSEVLEDGGQEEFYQAIAPLLAEGARSFLVRLRRRGGGYDGVFPVAGWDSRPDDARWSEVAYMDIAETEIVREDGVETYSWDTTHLVFLEGRGEVEVSAPAGDAVEGSFEFRGVEATGRFEAVSCDEESTIINFLGSFVDPDVIF